jgi:hypothetical protein
VAEAQRVCEAGGDEPHVVVVVVVVWGGGGEEDGRLALLGYQLC